MKVLKWGKQEEYFFALDIGTNAFKGLLWKKEGGKIIALKTFLRYFKELGELFEGQFSEEDFVRKAVLKTIEELGEKDNFLKKLQYIFLSLPGTVIKNEIFFITFEREASAEKITIQEAEALVKNIKVSAQKEIAQAFSKKTGILEKDLHFLDSEILEIKIDGYEISQLVGFSGRRMDFAVLFTFLLRYDLEKIRNIFRNLNPRILKISSPYQNFVSVLGDKILSALFLDIGGKISHVVVIQKGRIQRISQFLGGGDEFSQTLSQNLGISASEAEDLKIRYSKKLLSENVRKRIGEFFSPVIQNWFSSLKSTLQEIQGTAIILPPNIFIFGGGSLLPEVEEILREGDWNGLPFLKKPEVKFLLPRDFKNLGGESKVFTNPQYTPLFLIPYAKPKIF